MEQDRIKDVWGQGLNFVGILDCNLFYRFSYLHDHSCPQIFACDIKYFIICPKAVGSHLTIRLFALVFYEVVEVILCDFIY